MPQVRNYAIDFIKFFAIFIVVSVHTGFLKGFYVTELLDLHFFINTFSRFTVPFFFVISGFLIGQKAHNDPSKAYFKHYLWKTTKLFASWTLFFFLYDTVVRILFAVIRGESQKLYGYLDTFFSINTLYYGPPATAHQLWYLTALIWSVILLFVFVKWKKLNLLLIASFVLNLIGIFGQSYSVLAKLPIETRDALFYGLFYLTLGYYMAVHYKSIQSKLMKLPAKIYLALFFFFSITQMMERAYLLYQYGAGIGENYYFSTIPLIVSLILFVLASPALGKGTFVSKIGKTTVGIYVMHTFFISLVVNSLDLFGHKALLSNLMFQIVYTPSILIISYFSYIWVQKMKKYMQQRLLPLSAKNTNLSDL
ncbi:acyltransferase [Paenibacillus sp. N1-5-1-14]|uniref:acyltransferase n=1 Tax=Paenibacillus radicibacter TaxID=2972488 RepID=UPI002158E61E|nr:acyltransferase [Paenibacillus radicibacter]MCR8641076.1 acyltransferase [Paenibacillus radicibacter]